VRALVDTNVLLSGTLFGGVPARVLDEAFTGRFELVSSFAILREYEEKLTDRFDIPLALARGLREEIESVAHIAPAVEVPVVVRDPDDEHVIAAAIHGRAEVIVTGDKDLLDLGFHRGIRIITPRAFADVYL
jgi:putative PIN family toxin of toxin-antitoxin system